MKRNPEATRAQAQHHGRIAYRAGQKTQDNPHPAGSHEALSWEEGFLLEFHIRRFKGIEVDA